jgi:hypothetical protein
MLDKMKQLYDLQKKAKQVQKELELIVIEYEEMSGKLKMSMNGNYNVVNIVIDQSLLLPEKKQELENGIKRLVSNTCKQVQMKSALKMQEMAKSMGLPGIPGL